MEQDMKMNPSMMNTEDNFLNGMLDGVREDAAEPTPENQNEPVQPSQARALEARRRAEVRDFLAVFPEAARRPIPQEVWNAVNQGFSLTAAYALYLKYRQRIPTAYPAAAYPAMAYSAAPTWPVPPVQNAPPASTGSMRSAGYAYGPKDPFVDGLEGDW